MLTAGHLFSAKLRHESTAGAGPNSFVDRPVYYSLRRHLQEQCKSYEHEFRFLSPSYLNSQYGGRNVLPDTIEEYDILQQLNQKTQNLRNALHPANAQAVLDGCAVGVCVGGENSAVESHRIGEDCFPGSVNTSGTDASKSVESTVAIHPSSHNAHLMDWALLRMNDQDKFENLSQRDHGDGRPVRPIAGTKVRMYYSERSKKAYDYKWRNGVISSGHSITTTMAATRNPKTTGDAEIFEVETFRLHHDVTIINTTREEDTVDSWFACWEHAGNMVFDESRRPVGIVTKSVQVLSQLHHRPLTFMLDFDTLFPRIESRMGFEPGSLRLARVGPDSDN